MGSPLDSLVGSYSRLPVPTKGEQLLLGRAIRTWLDWEPSPDDAPPGVKRSGKRAREQLVSRNMLLVATQARSFSVSSSPALEVQDLIQEGAIGLTRAAELFDPALGYTFSTYAVPWIRQSMTQLVHTSGAIRIPVKRAMSMNQLRQWVEAFTAREGRSPTDQEAIEAMEITAGDLRILRQAAAVRQVGSLDTLIGDGEGDTFVNTVAAPTEPTGAVRMRRELLLKALKPWPQLVKLLELRMAGQTYVEIGLALGMTGKQAQDLAKTAQGLARRLVEADRQERPSLQLLVEIEIGEQLLLFPKAG